MFHSLLMPALVNHRQYPKFSLSNWQKNLRGILLFEVTQVASSCGICCVCRAVKRSVCSISPWTELRQILNRSSSAWEYISNIQEKMFLDDAHHKSYSSVCITAVVQIHCILLPKNTWAKYFRPIIEYIYFILRQERKCFVNR